MVHNILKYLAHSFMLMSNLTMMSRSSTSNSYAAKRPLMTITHCRSSLLSSSVLNYSQPLLCLVIVSPSIPSLVYILSLSKPGSIAVRSHQAYWEGSRQSSIHRVLVSCRKAGTSHRLSYFVGIYLLASKETIPKLTSLVLLCITLASK